MGRGDAPLYYFNPWPQSYRGDSAVTRLACPGSQLVGAVGIKAPRPMQICQTFALANWDASSVPSWLPPQSPQLGPLSPLVVLEHVATRHPIELLCRVVRAQPPHLLHQGRLARQGFAEVALGEADNASRCPFTTSSRPNSIRGWTDEKP